MENIARAYDLAPEPLRTAVFDEIPLFLAGLGAALRDASDLDVTTQVSVASALESTPERCNADVAVIGHVSGAAGTLGAVRRLHEASPNCRILALIGQPDAICAAELLRAGATGCALVTQPCEELVEAVRRTARGERYLAPSISASDVNAFLTAGSSWGLDRLTQRERQVFELLIGGASNENIAERLNIAYRTVETHRRHIMQKLAARSIVDLLHVAARHGMLG